MPRITENEVDHDSGDSSLGAWEALRFSASGGLTQFAASVEVLAPGAATAHLHWREEEDEMVYMLEGVAVLVEDGTEQELLPGMAACFAAGVAQGHRLENRSDAPVRFVTINGRRPRDRVHYPAHGGVVMHVERSTGARRWTRADGAPVEPLDK